MEKVNLIQELKNYLSSRSKEEVVADWQQICEETKNIEDEGVLYLNPGCNANYNAADYLHVVPQTDEEKFKMYMTTCSKEELAKMLVQANKTIEQMEKSFNNYSNSEKTY